MSKTIQAQNAPRKVGVGFGGTVEQPRPLVHATFYKRENGTVLVAMVKGGVIELRPTDRVVVSTDETEGWANLRMCNQCPTPHPRYVSAGKTGACYCRDSVNRSAATYRETVKSGKSAAERRAERLQQLKAERDAAVAARSDALMMVQPKSREQLIRVQLANIARLVGMDSDRFRVVAAQYGMTVEQGVALVGDALIPA